ncbi:heparinase II/III domain-containing protein [Spirillospora sp. CA-294931]|uniref:heparinase II/III domain-containing protein n=1 Tax=Spirillospora sp. CA-294931 TaxID=3240042 RepID=UPI003D93DA28
MRKRSLTAVRTVTAVAVLATACQGQSAESAATALVRPGKALCLGYNGLDALNPAAEVRAGRFRTVEAAPVQVAKGTDVDWGMEHGGDRTWQLWFHSLEWLGAPIKEYARTRDTATLDFVAGVVKDWLKDNEPARRFGGDRRESIEEGTKFRLITMTCLRAHLSAPWLDRAIARHAAWLAEPRHWSGPWNHGTDESMILMSAGCGIGREDLSAIGYGRLMDASRQAIDAQGANNEQSTQYAVYNRGRWRLAMAAMRACGRTVPADLVRRHGLMDEFIALQSTPRGDLLQLGETYPAKIGKVSRPGRGPIRYVVTEGRSGRKPARARIYSAGYVLGRSGWGDGARKFTEEMAYTARFGPGRYAHGQNDHMALTLFALGRDLIVPSGHVGYSDPTWQKWLRSPDAHNTLVVRDAPFRADAATALDASRLRRGGDFFRFSDLAFAGTRRTRAVLAAADPDALVVLDRATSAADRTVEQLWHLPADFQATASGTDAEAVAGDVRVHFLRIPLPGALPAQAVRGSVSPRQGWLFPAARTPRPAPVVTLGARGRDVRMLTLIAPVRGEGKPKLAVKRGTGGILMVTATFSGHRLAFEVGADGALRRLA